MPEIEARDPSIKDLSGLHLWHAPMSSCSQRVRITLAECDRPYTSHLVDLEKDEHATPAYQRIHPDGLVPALADDGKLFIESIDIIGHIAGASGPLAQLEDNKLLALADASQRDLKLLTFEFLFRAAPPPPPEAADAFQRTHQNAWLRTFRRDFASGFDTQRINDAIARTDAGFQRLDKVLADGRPYLSGSAFTLNDIAWMPNAHRFMLMDWPFEHTPHVQAWIGRVASRSSYHTGIVNWQPDPVAGHFSDYTDRRREEGTDVRAFPHFQTHTGRSA
ncbi:MAG: glutathione S-transferase family protein [Pseudomonadota bacterium]